MLLLTGLRRDPAIVTIRIAKELAIAEILPQQAELPQVIGDVLAGISDRSIRPHDDLVVFVRQLGVRLSRGTGALHYPAALLLPFGNEMDHALLFQLGKGCIPKVQPQDLTLAREKVI